LKVNEIYEHISLVGRKCKEKKQYMTLLKFIVTL